MTFTVKGKGQDTDMGYSYRLVCQQQNAPGANVNGQLQVADKTGPLAQFETVGTTFTLTQLAAILEPTTPA